MVKISNDLAELQLKQKFEKLVNGYKSNSHGTTLIEFFGDVSSAAITEISNSVELALSTDTYSRNIQKRSFAILIEGLQNIYRHGLQNEDGEVIGAFTLLETSDSIQLHFLNLIHNESIKSMDQFCEHLNNMSLPETKELYMQTLAAVDLTAKGGASLGCMLMKLKSDGHLNYKFEVMDKNLCNFHLTVTVFK